MEEELNIEELYEEVLYVYDDNIEAISIHMSYILDKMKKSNISFKKNKIPLNLIKSNLYNKKDLEKYRPVFIRILDTLKDEIEDFKKIAKLEITGISSMFYIIQFITEDKKILEKIDKRDITSKKKEIIELIIYLQNIIYNLENIETVIKEKK